LRSPVYQFWQTISVRIFARRSRTARRYPETYTAPLGGQLRSSRRNMPVVLVGTDRENHRERATDNANAGEIMTGRAMAPEKASRTRGCSDVFGVGWGTPRSNFFPDPELTKLTLPVHSGEDTRFEGSKIDWICEGCGAIRDPSSGRVFRGKPMRRPAASSPRSRKGHLCPP
jgi:hypothetical protein